MPGRVRQTPLKPERHEKLLAQEKVIYEAASSKIGRELGQAHLAKYGVEPDPSLNQPNAHKAPPIPPKGKSAMAAEKPPVNPHTVTAPAAPKTKQYGKLKRPATIMTGDSGSEYVIRGTNGEKHHAPGGKWTPEEKAYFNYEHPHERADRLAKSKAAVTAKKAAKAANPDFTTSESPERTNVHWHKGQEQAAPAAPKPSVAKSYAVEMTSQGVKNAIHSANPGNDADARTKAAPKIATPVAERKKVGMASGRLGGSAQANPVSKEPPTNPMPRVRATRPEPAVSATRAEPATGKSFSQHADEALSIANSGKSFDRHANEAMAIANSGRAPQPSPAKVTAKPHVSQPQFSRAQTAAPKPAPQPESTFVSTKAPAKTAAAPKPQGRYVESKSVDAVSGLEPSRAQRIAVKAAKRLDKATEYHAKDAKGRQILSAHNDELRQASKRQGPIDRLVNGPKERPEVTRSAARHATINAAINVGQKIQDRKLAKAQSGYEKARSKAESTHDAIRAGTKRGSTSDVGAVAGSVGRTVAKGAVAGAKVLAEGTRDIARAEVTGVKRIAARAKTEIAAKQGRAPEPPRPQPNRNINNRQFGSRNAPTKPENFGGK